MWHRAASDRQVVASVVVVARLGRRIEVEGQGVLHRRAAQEPSSASSGSPRLRTAASATTAASSRTVASQLPSGP